VDVLSLPPLSGSAGGVGAASLLSPLGWAADAGLEGLSLLVFGEGWAGAAFGETGAGAAVAAGAAGVFGAGCAGLDCGAAGGWSAGAVASLGGGVVAAGVGAAVEPDCGAVAGLLGAGSFGEGARVCGPAISVAALAGIELLPDSASLKGPISLGV
jgi:type IV secretion system protein TrbL